MNKESIVAYGAGLFFEDHIADLQKKYEVLYVIDNNNEKNGKYIQGIKCIHSSEMKSLEGYKIAITTINDSYVKEIRKEISKKGFEEIDIYHTTNNTRKIAIFGTLDGCRNLDVILSCYNSYKVIAYATNDYHKIGEDEISKKKICSYVKVQDLLRKGMIDELLICDDSCSFAFAVNFFDADIKGKCTILRKTANTLNFIKINAYRRLPNLQFLITPMCNLNCKLCSHFSPLVKNEEFYQYDKFEKDLNRLKLYIDRIDNLDLWGGEALLCKDLYKYIYKAKEMFNDSKINVGTNGILVKHMNKTLIDAIKETNSVLCISLYPILENFDDILSQLKEWGIEFYTEYSHLTSNPQKQSFFRRYDLSGDNNLEYAFNICTSKSCHTIYEGKVSGCYFPITSKYFNQYFGKEYFITDQDVINIYDDNLTTERFLTLLRTPMRSCRYCHLPMYEKWDRVGKETIIEDWIIK